MAANQTHILPVNAAVKLNIVSTHPPLTSPTRRLYPTLILLHYWGGSSQTWSPTTSVLSSVYPTIAIDFRGWGSSSGPEDPTAYSISHLAEDVIAVIRQLQIKDFILVGHSMGAKVAQLIAGRIGNSTVGDHHDLRQSLKGLILLGPAPPTPFALPVDMQEQQLHAFDNHTSAEFVARNVLTATELKPEVVHFLVQDMLKGNKWARAAWPGYAMGEDISDEAKTIDVPCLVIAAEKDVVEPVDKVKTEIVERLKKVKFAIVKESGHLLPVEAPEDVTEHILEFCKDLVDA